MQLKAISQQPDLKTSLSQAERYGHHLDAIQCAGLTTIAPIQMLSVEEEEKKLTSSINLDLSKLNENNSVPNFSRDVKNPSLNFFPHRAKALNSLPSFERKGAADHLHTSAPSQTKSLGQCWHNTPSHPSEIQKHSPTNARLPPAPPPSCPHSPPGENSEGKDAV